MSRRARLLAPLGVAVVAAGAGCAGGGGPPGAAAPTPVPAGPAVVVATPTVAWCRNARADVAPELHSVTGADDIPVGLLGHGSGGGVGVGGGPPGPPSKANLGQPTTKGDLDKAIIRRYIRRELAKISLCYEQELLRQPNLAGTVTATFAIGADGKVTSSKAAGLDATVAACVAGIVKAIEFPKPVGGGNVMVTYPFSFRPVGGAPSAPAQPWAPVPVPRAGAQVAALGGVDVEWASPTGAAELDAWAAASVSPALITPALSACRTSAQQRGSLRIELGITADGQARGATAAGLGDAAVEDCVASAVASLAVAAPPRALAVECELQLDVRAPRRVTVRPADVVIDVSARGVAVAGVAVAGPIGPEGVDPAVLGPLGKPGAAAGQVVVRFAADVAVGEALVVVRAAAKQLGERASDLVVGVVAASGELVALSPPRRPQFAGRPATRGYLVLDVADREVTFASSEPVDATPPPAHLDRDDLDMIVAELVRWQGTATSGVANLDADVALVSAAPDIPAGALVELAGAIQASGFTEIVLISR